MRIRLYEKVNPRYLYIDEATNTVHLMMPISSGTSIGADNTCKTVLALQEFFGKRADSEERQSSALHALRNYRRDLQYDINELQEGQGSMSSPASDLVLKLERLEQVNHLITALESISADPSITALRGAFPSYPTAVRDLMGKENANIYAMHLRPTHADPFMRTPNPAFTMNRVRAAGTFYHTIYGTHIDHFRPMPHKERFRSAIKALFQAEDLPTNAWALLEQISQRMSETHLEMFPNSAGIDFDLDLTARSTLDYGNTDSSVDNVQELNSIIDFLVENRCTGLDAFPEESVFSGLDSPIVQEKLSIMVQFFLGEVNIFARANGFTREDFGRCLDNDSHLASQLARVVKDALENNQNVEQKICEFINRKATIFCLHTQLSANHIAEISDRFRVHYRTVEQSPHMDEFLVLDSAHAETGRFFTHQNSLCCDFSDLLSLTSFRRFDNATTRRSREEATRIPGIVPARRADAVGYIEIEYTTLCAKIFEALAIDNYRELRRILSVTDDGLYVFEVLGRPFFERLSSDAQAKEQFTALSREIYDANLLGRFNRVVHGLEAQLVLTPEMAYRLYVEVAATQRLTFDETLNYSSQEAMTVLLRKLGIESFRLTRGFNGIMTLDTTANNIQRLNEILVAHPNKLHLTNSMSASLYKQVKENLGEHHPDYIEMMSLNNRDYPYKLIKALQLLNIDVNLDDPGISFPNFGEDYNGYIIDNLAPEALQVIRAVHQTQGHRFVVDQGMAARIYERCRSLNQHLFQQVDSITNSSAKLEMALAYLDIAYDSVEQGPNGELIVYLNAMNQTRMKVVAGLDISTTNPEEYYYADSYRPAMTEPGRKSQRNNLISQIQARAHLARVMAPAAVPVAGGGGRGAPSAAVPVAGGGRRGASSAAVPVGGGGRSDANAPRAEPSSGRFGEQSARGAFRGASSVASQRAADDISMFRVSGFGACASSANRVNPDQVELLCPEHILQNFRNLIRDTGVVGAMYTNPYTQRSETFPLDAEQFTARHLQILARIERYNTTGLMAFGQYGGLLTEEQICTLRTLVKATTVAGITYAERVGGYNSRSEVLTRPRKVILLDQAGFQWQEDIRNTGSMFFYPQAPGSEYRAWQSAVFRAYFDMQRPETPSYNSVQVTWNGTHGQLDLDLFSYGIQVEFEQALDAARMQGHFLAPNERINFAYLKAGMGFFASGLSFGSAADRARFDTARLQGILNALQKIAALSQQERERVLGRIGRIELPYSGNDNQALLVQIERCVASMRLEWGGAASIGGYHQREGWITATTNCGDNHAMPSNEGGYASVDAEYGTNAYVGHLNAAYNDQMLLRQTASYSHPAVAASSNREILRAPSSSVFTSASSSRETPSAGDGEDIEFLVQCLLIELSELYGGRDVGLGHWVELEQGVFYGRNRNSGLLGLRDGSISVSIEDNGTISVKNGEALVSGEARDRALNAIHRKLVGPGDDKSNTNQCKIM